MSGFADGQVDCPRCHRSVDHHEATREQGGRITWICPPPAGGPAKGSLAGARAYAKRYPMIGQEPESQMALHVLAFAVEAHEATLEVAFAPEYVVIDRDATAVNLQRPREESREAALAAAKQRTLTTGGDVVYVAKQRVVSEWREVEE